MTTENAEDATREIDSEAGGTQARPSLTERLMSADPPAAARAPRVTPRPTRTLPVVRPVTPATDAAMKHAERFIKIRYAVFLVSVGGVLILTGIGAAVFVVEMLGDMDWETLAVSGGLAAVALAALVLLQYRPASGFGSAAFQIAQLEAARSSIDRSFELWDGFLERRAETDSLTANDIAAAVASLTSASKTALDIEAAYEASRGRRNAAGNAPASRIPTAAAPDPRRF